MSASPILNIKTTREWKTGEGYRRRKVDKQTDKKFKPYRKFVSKYPQTT